MPLSRRNQIDLEKEHSFHKTIVANCPLCAQDEDPFARTWSDEDERWRQKNAKFHSNESIENLRIVIQNILVESKCALSERRMREADISDGSKVKWGDKKHVLDLRRRIAEMSKWRDKQPRGSDKRADYQRIVTRLKGELASAIKATQKK